jgi:asparagine synthase (glutamine-hydrolysing)
MSGILGIWNLDGRPAAPELVSAMSATMAHRGPDGAGQWLEGPVGLACQLMRVTPESLTETQPLVGHCGAVLVFDGRLDNREELLSLLKREPGVEPSAPDPALVLAAYDKYGDRFPEYLNGEFALGLFDPRRRQLMLARDAVGLRTLYYSRSGDVFLFSSEIKAILAHPQIEPQPDDDFLSDLYGKELACPLEGLTFFKGVTNFFPGYSAILSPKGFTLRQYWDFDLSRRLHFGSFPDYAEAFRHYFQQAVARCLRSAYPVAVSVSGGLDSSAIFCMAKTLKNKEPERYPAILGFSCKGPEGSLADEDRFVKEVENHYGCSIERLSLGPKRLTDKPEEEIWHSEVPFLFYEDSHRIYQVSGHYNSRVLIAGSGGDQFLADLAYLIDLLHGLAWGRLNRHLLEVQEWGVHSASYRRRVFWRAVVKRHLPVRLVDGLRKLLGRPAAITTRLPGCVTELERRAARKRKSPFQRQSVSNFHARSLYEIIRSAYELFEIENANKISSMHGLQSGLPFYDRDLLSFLMAIPGEMINWRGVSKGILREGLRGILPEAIVQRRSKADFTDLGNEGMILDYPRVLDAVLKGTRVFARGYVNKEGFFQKLENMRARILAPNILLARSLLILLSLETWLEVFFERLKTE